MSTKKRRGRYVLAFFVAATALEVGRSQAWAVWDMGFGLFRPVPSPQEFINNHALIRAGAGQRAPSRNVYANNPNSYINRVRDNGFSSHYGLGSRRSPGFDVDRSRPRGYSRTSNNQPQPAIEPATDAKPPTDARPVYPIGSFLNASRKLVWPSDAPVDGDLGAKRDASDQASLTVVELVEKHGSAPITTVTVARQKLLDYGQPALRLIRSLTTPQVAEGFHLFLLSLYDSLAAAAIAPESIATTNPAP
jgi:hypothetical protein